MDTPGIGYRFTRRISILWLFRLFDIIVIIIVRVFQRSIPSTIIIWCATILGVVIIRGISWTPLLVIVTYVIRSKLD